MYLITEEYLKQVTHIEFQLSEELILVAFNEVDRFYIKSLIPEELLAALLQAVDTKAVLTGKRKELLDDLRYYFAIRAHHSLLGFSNVKTTNRGAVEPENGAELDRLQYLRGKLEEKATFLQNAIEGYMKKYPAEFPELTVVEKDALNPVKSYSGFIHQPNRNYILNR